METVKYKIKKDDLVVVIAGKSKGAKGKVLSVDRSKGKITVEKVNLIKKHVKKTQGQPGQVAEREAAFDISNVMLVDPKTDKPTRVGYKTLENGQKVRFAKKSGEILDKE